VERAGDTVTPGTGNNTIDVVYSDDAGVTWQRAGLRLTAPVYEGYNGANYGAVEPNVVPLPDGRLWMLIRTQTGWLYQTFSRDGVTWTDAEPSPFPSSNSPSEAIRLEDGRTLLVWNNTVMPPRHEGQGVYGGRDAVHAAVADAELRTWHGFREVFRDPTRNDTPPKRGDRGTAYPNLTQAADGDVILITGQGEHARRIIRFDPAWLMESRASEGFEEGLDGWSVFTEIGAAERWWRDRTTGAELVVDPAQPDNHALRVGPRNDRDADGAVWNFPAGRAGTLSLRLWREPGATAGHLALADRYLNPTDPTAAGQSVFLLDLSAASDALPTGQWIDLTLTFDTDAGTCEVHADGRPIASLPAAVRDGLGVSYFRLRADNQARGGWIVDDLSVSLRNAGVAIDLQP
jgi:hypothetical protein